jgi:hypothetical protein
MQEYFHIKSLIISHLCNKIKLKRAYFSGVGASYDNLYIRMLRNLSTFATY